MCGHLGQNGGMNACSLCVPVGEAVLWSGARVRVIDAADPDYPGYCRVIWNTHVREMADLDEDGRRHLMDIVWVVEAALLRALRPEKINLAALGNQVPHLHWHVIPRFADDAHFPDPIWAPKRRAPAPRAFDRDAFGRALAMRLGAP